MREDEERRKRKEKQEEDECLRTIREAEEAERIRMEQDSRTWTPVFRKAKASGKSQTK
jgi:hypothetical protein